MTLNELKTMLKGVPGDIEVAFRVTDENDENELSPTLARVDWLRFIPEFSDCNSIEFVLSSSGYQLIKPEENQKGGTE